MDKVFILLGISLIGYSVLAMVFGFPLITDFLPVSGSDGSSFQKIVQSSEASYENIGTILAGTILILLPFIIKFLKTK